MDWLLNTLTGPVRSYLATVFDYVNACEKNVDDLSTEAEELESMRAGLRAQLDDVERQGEPLDGHALWWVEKAKDLMESAADVKVQFEKRVQCVGDISPAVWSVYRLSKRAEELVEKVKDHKSKRSEIKTLVGAEPAPEGAKERPIGSTVVGMESVLKKLLGYIRDENVNTIGVHGMGGVGKTELLSHLFNELRDMKLKYIIWIEMPFDAPSADDDVSHAQKSAFQGTELKWDASKSRKERAQQLSKKLSQGDFVLIIDGLWRTLDLREVGIPSLRCPTKFNIIVATRIESLCDQMGAQKKVPMKCLEWQDAWELFVEKVGQELIDSKSSAIRSLATELAKKCGGLPLALIHVGIAMRSKKTWQEWQHESKILSTKPWRLIAATVLSPLKLSSDEVTDQSMRTCLLYCSLYPENCKIHKDWIIDYCIGEGVIDDTFDNVHEMYNTGRALLGMLEGKSLLESCNDENYLRIHPMIRGMMMWTESENGKLENKCLVRAGCKLRAPPLLKDWSRAQRISLMRNDLQELSESPKCPDLLTLFLHENGRLKKICDGFFQSMVNLRVLDLSHTSITELPAGIEVLKELRYLDLCGTKIKALPSELGMLRKLTFFLLSFTSCLEYIPDGVIENLPELQVLYLDGSYSDLEVDSIGSGINFDELNRLEKLRALGITIKSVRALRRLLESSHLPACVRRLYVKDCAHLETRQWRTIGRSIPGLDVLCMSNCHDLEDIVFKGDDSNQDGDSGAGALFPRLQTLGLQQLPKARIILDGGCLRNLCYLYIRYCDRIEQLFCCMDEEIERDGDDDKIHKEEEESYGSVIQALPQLKKMHLEALSKLKSLRCGRRRLAFPRLEIVVVVACPQLKKLELVAEKLSEIQGSKRWWDGLDDATKSAFTPLFKEKKLGK